MANETLGASFTIDVTQLKAGLSTANKLIRESESEFKRAAAGLDDWSKSEDGVKAKIKSLNDITDVQRKKVDALKEEYRRLVKEGLDETSDRAIALRTQINKEEAALRSNEAELQRQTAALKNLGKEAQDTADEIEQSGEGWTKFGNMAKRACQVAAAAIAAVSAAVIALTKQAVEGYAEYEQLVGGVETLFGAGGKSIEEYAKEVGKSVDDVRDEYNELIKAQTKLLDNANDAYKTAGMSANDYLSNVTSFSAALISSLGGDTVKAAELADKAMTDISDNANKMGSDISSIIQTYQSLARGNYQTLDNLKIGYGGTRSEMERMIADANRIQKANGEAADLSADSFADMVRAIHIVQTEMGITGTTAKEASTTIQGSVSSMKAAWSNLIAGLADDTKDFSKLVGNFVDSLTTAADNLLPRIAAALNGVIQLIKELIPRIPPLIDEFLPTILDGVAEIIEGIIDALPEIVNGIAKILPKITKAIIKMLPKILKAVATVISSVISAIADAIPDIVSAVMEILPKLVNGLINAIPQLLAAALKLLNAIVQAIPVIVQELAKQLPEIISTIVQFLIDNIPVVIDAAIQLLMSIVDAIPEIVTALVEALPQIFNAIIDTLFNPDNIQKVLDAAVKLMMAIVDAIPKIILALVDALPRIIETVVTTLTDGDNLQKVIEGAVQLLMGIVEAIPQIIAELIENLPQIITSIVEGLADGIPRIFEVGARLMEGLWEGMQSTLGWLGDQIEDAFNDIIDDICYFLGIKSPSRVMEQRVGKNMALGIGVGFEKNIGKVNDEIVKSISRFNDMNFSINGDVKTPNFGAGRGVVVNQVNNYSQAHSRYEIWQSKQEAAAAVRLAIETV